MCAEPLALTQPPSASLTATPVTTCGPLALPAAPATMCGLRGLPADGSWGMTVWPENARELLIVGVSDPRDPLRAALCHAAPRWVPCWVRTLRAGRVAASVGLADDR
mmetsp:Transcript_54703/g.125980  ORF Transcript_54703/g.125980 Transcript_54703/m.125980 type:complete len:107 (-) Transcript_54703:247-567(-)